MRRLSRPLSLVGLLLAMTFLSGCLEGEEEPRVILQASHLVGEDLYSWGDPEFTKPFGVGGSRRIRAEFEVPADIERVGVAFRGRFVWPENSTARFDIETEDGQRVLALNASAGREDDQGTISTFWQFRPVLPVDPGLYKMVATGSGYIGSLEFQVHGIPSEETSINETFRVSKTGTVELQIFVQGWGRTPTVTLTGPDGEKVDLGIRSPEDDVHHRFEAKEGTYHLDVDTTRWGGRFVARAVR